MSQLKNSDQKFVFSDKEILAECESFFSNFYSSQGDLTESEFSKVFSTKKETCSVTISRMYVRESSIRTNV